MSGLWGALWWWLLPVRKRLAIANFQAAFPERDPAELRSTIDEIASGYLDLALGRRARIEGLEHLAGGGRILLSGHGGAWDLGMLSLAERVPLTVFVRLPRQALARWLLARLRRSGDFELLPPRGSKAAAYAALERGRTVLFIQDQRHNAGIPVPFFGRPAWTSPAFAAMAWRTRAPLVGGWTAREGDGHVVRLAPLALPVPEDREQAIASLTAATQRYYEAQIRARPHSWLWLHDRWKSCGVR